MEIAWHPSPTHRPRTQPIRLIVLHATVGSYDSALGWLCNPASGVSTHYLIRKDGHTAQLVADDQVANHAGVSRWRDVRNVNGISLGIELENANDGRDPYPQAQLASLRALLALELDAYALDPACIVSHAFVAPERKTDPAGLDVVALRHTLGWLGRYAVAAPTAVYEVPAIEPTRIALGGEAYYRAGLELCIDMTYDNGMAHDAGGLGFVPLTALRRL